MSKKRLKRFRRAHLRTYKQALSEIQKGHKESHWIWFIFPQINGLGKSFVAKYYAIKNIEEAQEFLLDPYLGGNLRGICEELLKCKTQNPRSVFGDIDVVKLHSSMTLFFCAGNNSKENRVFGDMLAKFFNNELDKTTLLRLIEIQNRKGRGIWKKLLL